MVTGSVDNNPKAGSVPAMILESMTGAEQQDPEEKPLRIMLLGKSGVGKSSSGNTILGQHVFKSDMRLGRVTPHCEKGTGIVNDVPVDVTKKVKNVPVTVIDTPGFFEKDRNEEDNVREVLQCVKLQGPGPHAFVLVVQLGRMTQEDKDTNALIEARFGPRVWDYTIVLFTHGDRLDEKTINDVIAEGDDNLRNFIRKCSGGFHVFNNKNPQDQVQVTSFIAKIETLVALNGGKHYSTALYPKEERRIRERQESILAEREDEISEKEKQLKENYQGDELEERIRRLWRNEEKTARQAAEDKTKMKSMIFIMIGLLIGVVSGVYLNVWLPAVALGIILYIILWIFFEGVPSPSRKIPWFSKKTE